MVTTITGAAGVGYYAGGGGGVDHEADAERAKPASYYLGAAANGEPPGRWSGKLATDMGLTGKVEASVMAPLYETWVAPDGTKLGNAPRQYKTVEQKMEAWHAEHPGALPEAIEAARKGFEGRDSKACLAEDATFSPPKDFTVLHTAAWRAQIEAEARGDLMEARAYEAVKARLEGALWTANQAMLDYLTENATSRAGTHGKGKQGWWVEAGDLAVASFHQHTTRANRGDDSRSIDPQQHIHNVILNKARNADGEYRTLDTKDLGWKAAGISAVGDRVLAEEMVRLGLEMRLNTSNLAWQSTIVSEELKDLFSTRRGAITAKTAELIADIEERFGRPVTEHERREVSRNAWKWTRVQKESTESDWKAHLDAWQKRSQAETGRGLVPVAAQLRAAVEKADREATREALTGLDAAAEAFSPEAILGAAREAVQREAMHATGRNRGTWTKGDYMREISRALPLMPNLSPKETTRLVELLAEEGMRNAVQVSGRDTLPSLGVDRPGLGFVRPSDQRWASPETILGEQRIRAAGVERGGFTLDREAVSAWLDANVASIGPDQRAMVEGIASSDARWSLIIGKAGTGKSFAAGALAGVMEHVGGARVLGLSTAESAADVLQEEGVKTTANLDRFLAAQDRIASGRMIPGDEAYIVDDRTVLLVDEASMVAAGKVDRVRELAEQTKAKVSLMGDPRQMGAIGAGGALDLLHGRAETYTLTEIRRFLEDWEKDASVRLWDGDVSALEEYDRRGRLLEYEAMPDAIREAARAAAADILEGKSTLVVAGSNQEAAAVSAGVRALLVDAGRVEAEGVNLGLDENTAGAGDRVMTRKNDYDLGVLNRARFTVAYVGEDGSLVLADKDGVEKTLPREYVEEHVQLGYGSTVHGAQGQTVDRAHYLTDGRTGLDALYVGMTRGRERNTVHVSLSTPDKGLEKQTYSGELQVEESAERPSAYSVLKRVFERDTEPTSALIADELDEMREWNAKHLLERRESVTDLACRDRLERHLDRLLQDGVLDVADRAELCADQGTAHLARIMRAVEQTGSDPFDVLRDAVSERGLHDARSPAQALAARVSRGRDLSTAAPGGSTPADISDSYRVHLDAIAEREGDRAMALGGEVAEKAPAWAVAAFGAVPEEPIARLEWEARAGRVAAYREAAEWVDEKRPIPSAPGITNTEHRSSWWAAWDLLGRPEATREEAGMTDGRLQTRVQAWEREKAWLPPHADEALKASEVAAEKARTEAVHARARGDEATAAALEAEAAEKRAAAEAALTVADGRRAAYEETAETRAAAGRARAELRARDLDPGAEPDRVTAREWLEAHLADRDAEEADRMVVAESEVRDHVAAEVRDMDAGRDVEGEAEVDVDAEVPDVPWNLAHRVLDPEASADDLEPHVADALDAMDRVADRASQEAAHEATPEPYVDAGVAEVAAVEVS